MPMLSKGTIMGHSWKAEVAICFCMLPSVTSTQYLQWKKMGLGSTTKQFVSIFPIF